MKSYKSVFVYNGAGYGNAGDEAQLASTLSVLYKKINNKFIFIFSPNPSFTAKYHSIDIKQIIKAPREIFFGASSNKLFKYYAITNKKLSFILKILNNLLKLLFFMKCLFIIFLIKIKIFKIKYFVQNFKTINMIKLLSTIDTLYFSGGGYLTGATKSRLWECLFLISLKRFFHYKIILTGQQINDISTLEDKYLSKKFFRLIDLLSVRDSDTSINELKKFEVPSNKIFDIGDDALFYKYEIDFSKKTDQYLLLNIHLWEFRNDTNLHLKLDQIFKELKSVADKQGLKLYFLAMVPQDRSDILYLKNKFKWRATIINKSYHYNIIATYIKHAECLISMKHHPLIFSLNLKKIPISLNFSKYYQNKNQSALKKFNLEKFSLNIDNFKNHILSKRVTESIKNKNYQDSITKRIKELRLRKNIFDKKIFDLISK